MLGFDQFLIGGHCETKALIKRQPDNILGAQCLIISPKSRSPFFLAILDKLELREAEETAKCAADKILLSLPFIAEAHSHQGFGVQLELIL